MTKGQMDRWPSHSVDTECGKINIISSMDPLQNPHAAHAQRHSFLETVCDPREKYVQLSWSFPLPRGMETWRLRK